MPFRPDPKAAAGVLEQCIDTLGEAGPYSGNAPLGREPPQQPNVTRADGDVAIHGACPHGAVVATADGAHPLVGYYGHELHALLVEVDQRKPLGRHEPKVSLAVYVVLLDDGQVRAPCLVPGAVRQDELAVRRKLPAVALVGINHGRGRLGLVYVGMGRVGHRLIAAGVGVVEVDVAVVGFHPHVVKAVNADSVDTVGCQQIGTVGVGVEGGELLAVVAAESVPCSYPQQSTAVLLHVRNLIGSQPVADVERTDGIGRLCLHWHSLPDEECDEGKYQTKPSHH